MPAPLRQTLRLLVAVVVGAVTLAFFLGFFFVWVLAPVVSILVFYLVFLASDRWVRVRSLFRRGPLREHPRLRVEAEARAAEPAGRGD